MFQKEEVLCGGVVQDEKIEGYQDNIESKEIKDFEYIHPQFRVKCQKQEDHLEIEAQGGNSFKRDGTLFELKYETKILDLLEELERIQEEYHLSKDNGRVYEVAGLPSGLGDTLKIEYESGETIYKRSNQSLTISEEAVMEIYEAFHANALKNGYDFTTEKSTTKIYDDAEEDFLQGTWRGTHFGEEIVVTFENHTVTIYKDQKKTDEIDYVIREGEVLPNRKKEGHKGEEKEDYEFFHGLSSIRKKNDILLTAYFKEGTYSTCELLIDREAKR